MKKINLFKLKTKCKLRSNHLDCFSNSISNAILDARMAIFVYIIFMSIVATGSLRRGNLLTPQTYNPLNGDLSVQLQYFSHEKFKTNNELISSMSFGANENDVVVVVDDDDDDFTKTTSAPKPLATNDDVRLQVSRYTGTNRTTVAFIDVYPDPRSNITQISVSCLNFLYGGTYELEIVGGNDVDVHSHTLDNHDERLRQQLDVRWPQPKLTVTPESIGTYPEQPVDVILEFPGIECIAPHMQIDNIPEFWLELFYCGHEVYCDSANVSSSQVLYAEEVRGYPKARLFKLSCELFGLAGHYVVKLRGIAPVSPTVTATAFIKADWSEQFVFNVHARSISPCDPHTGIGVLFEYPACILDRADRIRLFGKLRADVVSLAPPTSLHYITEQRVVRGQHALHFDCDYFSEKFVEYCFVYVSQAISGAVADVRMDCLPTLPVRENDLNAGWSEWSAWTPCSTTCAGGTRNRYRSCDNPPPRYGARFCDGPSVETHECGGSISDSWDCIYGATGTILPSDFVERPEIKADTGSDCRCGCIIHLTLTKPRRIIAASAQSCPGRTFWLIQADSNHRIRFHFDFFRLICSDQYIRVRDGDSLAAELIGEFIGGTGKNSDPIVSASSKLLLEFYSNELSTMGESCKGAFLTHAQQIQTVPTNATATRISKASNVISIPTYTRLTMVHVIAILFCGLIIFMSALLLAQYVCRYRKYQLAESASEDSPAHTPRASIGSLGPGLLPSRAVSTTTLFSEVVSFIKARPRGRWMKHARLRESVDGEALENALQAKRTLSDDTASLESTHTLTNETCNGSNDACELSDVQMATKRTKNHKQDNCSTNGVENSNEALSQHLSTSPSSNSYDGGDDTDIRENDDFNDGKIENGTSFDQQREPKKKSCNSISLPRTPADTPMPVRRNVLNKKRTPIDAQHNNLVDDKEKSTETTTPREDGAGVDKSNKSSGSDDALTDAKSANGKTSSRKKRQNHLNLVGASNERITNAASRRSDAMRRLSVSNATLRNSCYSPASSIISVSTNRSTNIKESKEKKNREKLLAGPGSEFSLANPDMEMDYYDYNVINAASVPGSYLGMDPAYLVYIPPLEGDDDNNEHEYDESDASDETEPHYEEISSVCQTESNDEIVMISEQNNRNRQFVAKHFNSTENDSDSHPRDGNKSSASSLNIGNLVKKSAPNDSIQMTEIKRSNEVLRNPATPNKLDQVARCSYVSDDKDVGTEKETTVVKSPSDNNFKEYYELDDIQFADDDEDDEEIIQVFNGKQNNFDAIKTHGREKNKQNVLESH